MIAVDDADADNGGLEVVSGCFDSRAPHRRARVHRPGDRRLPRVGTGRRCRAGRDACGSTAARRTAAAPTTPTGPRRALYPTYNAAREGDRRAEYYAQEARRVRATAPGRPRPGLAHRRLRGTAAREGRVHRARRAARRATWATDHTPVLAELARAGGGAPGGARGDDVGDVPEPRDVRHRRRTRATTASSPTGCRRPVGSSRRGSSARRCRRCSTRAVPRAHRARPSFGDQCLVGVMGALAADTHWPPER